ncbi:nucleotidyl transferase AbiEii/AbiGii toxin family protein [Rhodococcus sp. USK10]|uniref:nucleotidyl transferase AbiEii/AbiGii toxin family protein n=1 Tax=Rhodococcus sp. USK10 TaxID=2789739 RepID=UPI0027E4609A|nr:nucleotidyl transferase AbiEii/AbiGii toxin family protein [Rhodococcus sp. USK10]
MLTDFQLEVAQLFFTLPASKGFLLAGGAALIAQHLSTRPTHDLDFFTGPNRGDVTQARDEFEQAADTRGWRIDRIHDGTTFCRLLIHGPEQLLVDLALDSAPGLPATASVAGPTYAPEELAGRKLIALFDRAEARDFADIYALSAIYDKDTLLTRAAEIDAGFDPQILATMLDSLQRFPDHAIPTDPTEIPPLRAFFTDWAHQLRHRPPHPHPHPHPHPGCSSC